MLIDDAEEIPPADAGEEAEEAAPKGEGKLRYSDADFLRLVRDERQRSIGFGDGDNGELEKHRVRSQEYRKGQIRDLKTMDGRSAAVDTALSDAADTVMPDLMEVFFGGDDVVTFDANGEEDEAQAREESDVLAQVVFGRNDAFIAFHAAIQDALYNRTGVFYWWWEEETKPAGVIDADNAQQAAVISHLMAQRAPWGKVDLEHRDDGTIALNFAELRGKACFKAVPSEDFTVAADTVVLRKTTYCCLRDRPRIQDLIARGIDKAQARALTGYNSRDGALEQARDRAGESDQASDAGIDDLRIVETRMHFLRVDADDDGDVELWRIETNGDETVLLQKEKVTQVPFGALTPYLVAHRFTGESLFDKLAEVMRIKTVLMRMLLDSGYFALNQRYEVSEDAANEFTIADLLNNAPNVPVRSKNGMAVRALSAGQLGFDVMGALEFMSTVGEQRSGVVRNAQGMNPDTLHETARGVSILVGAAQKRTRMIARTFSETGVKDLFLGMHQMLRENMGDQHAPMNAKLGGNWKQINPGDWPERDSLTVHVGVGSSDSEKNMDVQEKMLEVTQSVIELQGGAEGPFVDQDNVYNRLKAYSRAAGEKQPERYWSDPSAPPKPGAQPPAPKQDPAMAKVQADAQAQQLQIQNQHQLDQMKLQGQLQIQQQESAAKLELERQRAEVEIQLRRQETAATLQLKSQQQMLGASRSTSLQPDLDNLPGGDV